ncbi:MAG TPA: glycosyltransferase family 4 protein [Mucilaginibacter sp.]|nr:glycosyltransferase family 4 protein [Mucilaginibacter sp.]
MNILFILPEYYPHSGGGISTYYLQYIRSLKPYCGRIKVITGSGYIQSDEELEKDGIEIVYLKPAIYHKYLEKFSRFELFTGFRNDLAAAWAMYEQANEGKGFDIIECADFGLGFIPWVIRHNKPVVTRFHGSTGQITRHEGDLSTPLQNDFIRQTELLLLPLCDVLISHSAANQQAWKTLLAKKITHILPVFKSDTNEPVPYSERTASGVVTARIQVWKGPVQLCEALKHVNGPVLPIEWYGRDCSYENGKSMSAYLAAHYPDVWGKSVIPRVALGPDEVSKKQAHARFGLVCSAWDMFNFTCAEFLNAGTPVICSDGAGASELIRHGENGLIYPAYDTQKLADCLKEMSQMDESAYSKMAAAAKATTANELLAGKIIPKNLAQYSVAIDEFNPSAANDFLEHIYSPSDKAGSLADTLDSQPLKKLVKYLLKRAGSKMKK